MKSTVLITLYYALASIIGLVLSVIGVAMFVNLILSTYVFKIPKYPSMPPQPIESTPLMKGYESASDSALLEEWKREYAQWEKDQKDYDLAGVDKKNQLATSISLIVVGLPVLFFHQRELKKI